MRATALRATAHRLAKLSPLFRARKPTFDAIVN